LEARVAAFQLLQKELDDDAKTAYEVENDMMTAAASFETFALLGSAKGKRGNLRIPRCALFRWNEQRELDLVDDTASEAKGAPASQAKDTPASQAKDTPAPQAKDTPDSQAKDSPASRAKDTADSQAKDTPDSQAKDILDTLDTVAKETLDYLFSRLEPNHDQLLQQAAKELRCDSNMLKMIQDKWDIALALKDAIEEYRNILILVPIDGTTADVRKRMPSSVITRF
jgi:hypothetical protein